jgi:hypothetical protein
MEGGTYLILDGSPVRSVAAEEVVEKELLNLHRLAGTQTHSCLGDNLYSVDIECHGAIRVSCTQCRFHVSRHFSLHSSIPLQLLRCFYEQGVINSAAHRIDSHHMKSIQVLAIPETILHENKRINRQTAVVSEQRRTRGVQFDVEANGVICAGLQGHWCVWKGLLATLRPSHVLRIRVEHDHFVSANAIRVNSIESAFMVSVPIPRRLLAFRVSAPLIPMTKPSQMARKGRQHCHSELEQCSVLHRAVQLPAN